MSTSPSHATLRNFETLFDSTPRILDRAMDYWASGKVMGCELVMGSGPLPTHYRATVRGSGDAAYTVTVQLAPAQKEAGREIGGCGDGPTIDATSCDCPYTATPYCKHIGAVLYELRERICGGMPDDDGRGRRADRETAKIPRYVLEPIMNRIEQEVQESDGRHVLFFWSVNCVDYAEHLRLLAPQSEAPLIPAPEAGRMILGPMEEYRQLHGGDDGDPGDPGAPGHGLPGAMPFNPLHGSNPFDQALSGLDAVVRNALHSTDYANACLNLAVAIQALAAFTNATRDDLHILSNANDVLVSQIRCYMENVASDADSPTASMALDRIVEAAYSPDIQFYDPMNAAMLLGSALAFARHDDKTMWAYDVIDTALERFSPAHDGELPLATLSVSRHILRHYLLMVAYDLHTLADDREGREALFRDYPSFAPLALVRVIELMRAGRFRQAMQAARSFLTAASSLDGSNEIGQGGLLDGLLPHGWHTIMECCAEGMDDADALASLYRHYIVHANDQADVAYVDRLRRLLRITTNADDEEWHAQALMLARDCARNIAWRIKHQPEMVENDDGSDGRHSSWRNPAYERLIVDERLSDDALTYCTTVDYPPLPLLKTMAIAHPDRARDVIYAAMPPGALPSDLTGTLVHSSGSVSRDDLGLDARRPVYRQIAKQLKRLATVFGEDEARELAHIVVARYPNRRALAEELGFML